MATLAEVVTALRAAATGSTSLDNVVADFLVVPRNLNLTTNADSMRARLPGGVVIQHGVDSNGEHMVTVGTPPAFADHVHGWHQTNPHLAAVCGILTKLRPGA